MDLTATTLTNLVTGRIGYDKAKSRYEVQGHARSRISVPIKNPYATFYA